MLLYTVMKTNEKNSIKMDIDAPDSLSHFYKDRENESFCDCLSVATGEVCLLSVIAWFS